MPWPERALGHNRRLARAHGGTRQRGWRLARQSTPTPSMKKPKAKAFDGSATSEHPPLFGVSVAADVAGGAGGAAETIGLVEGTTGAADAVADVVTAADGGGLAADADPAGTDADTQRKWALNLKRKWSSFSSTQVPGSSRCSDSPMT